MSNITIYRFALDMTPGGVTPVVHLSQYDEAFQLEFTLYSRSGELDIPSGATAMIEGTKLDGKAYSANATISGNVVTVAGDVQISAVAGNNPFQIVLKSGNSTVGSANFTIAVERAAMDYDTVSDSKLAQIQDVTATAAQLTAAAENVTDGVETFEALAESVSDMLADITDDTLSITDKAADAAAVGNALAAEIAPKYSTSATYAVGDYVIYNNALYRCNTAIATAESWTAAHWTAVKVGSELSNLKSDLTNDFESFEYLFPFPISVTYESGSISANGGTTSNNNRIRTKSNKMIQAQIGDAVWCDTVYELRVGVWSANSMTAGNFVGWINEYKSGAIVVPDEYAGKYIGVLIRKIGYEDSDISGDVATIDTHIMYNRKKTYFDNMDGRITANETEFVNLFTQKDFLYCFELGNINGATSPPSYSSSKSRVRTMRYNYLELRAGDIISLSDFAGLTMHIGWQNESGEWKSISSWRSTPYKATENGRFWILIRYATEADITDMLSIVSKIRIFRHVDINDDIYRAIQKARTRKCFVKSINHRGYNRIFPENTLIAYKGSAIMGFDCVETDVRFTSDGVPVLLHDESINRTARSADGTTISDTVNINSITYEQALTYDFGIKYGPKFAGTKIPSFEDFIKLCRKLSVMPYIEVKTGSMSVLVDMVKKCGMLRNVTWISFNSILLQNVLTKDPKARLGLVAENYSDGLIAEINNLKTNENEVFLDLLTTSVTDEVVEMLIENDIPLEVYAPNAPSEIDNLDPYITGVTSDWYPAGWVLYDRTIEISLN